MNDAILLLLTLATTWLLVRLGRTPLGFSPKRGHIGGIFLIPAVFLELIIAVNVMELINPADLGLVNAFQGGTMDVSLTILATLGLLLAAMLFFSKNLNLRIRPQRTTTIDKENLSHKSLEFIFPTALLIILCIGAFSIYGLRHAMLSAILSGGNLLDFRLENRHSGVPTQLLSFFRFLCLFLATIIAINSNRIPRIHLILYLLFLSITATYLGSKAPLIYTVGAVLLIKHLTSKQGIKILHLILASFTVVALSVAALYLMTKLQYSDLNFESYSSYLLKRAVVGQIGATYEQFALNLQSSSYIWHSVPFASFFVDYPVFNKDLMLSVYHWKTHEETGVANSYFIAEAHAIGGWTLVWVSPLIVGLSYVLYYVLISKFCRIYGFSVRDQTLFTQIFTPLIVAGFTGDISGFLFLKMHVMGAIFLCAILLTSKLLNFAFREGLRNPSYRS